MSTYKCIECGTEFTAAHKTALCPECKSKPLVCVICGKEFPKKYFPYNQKTCSPECRGKYRAQSGIAKAGATKMKQTKMDRYGTLDPAEVTKARRGGELAPKECEICHKMFIPNTPWQIYCTDTHYAPCPVCGKPTVIKDLSSEVTACSEACRLQRIYKTNIERYGCKDAVNSEHARELGKQHSLERYGKEYYMQTDEFKVRYKQTSLEKYGTEHPMQNKELQEKARNTSQERYGAEFYMQTEEGKKRYKETCEEKYGGMGLASPILRERITATNREVYGFDFAIQNPEVREKAIKTNREKYGVDNFWQSKQSLEDKILDPSKIDEYYEFKQDARKYIESHYDVKPPIYTLAHDVGTTDTPVYDILIKQDCKDAIDRTKQSTMEWEVSNFLHNVLKNSIVVENDRTMIKPYELDFYMPEFNFAIECNPTLTHNSTADSWKGAGPKPYNYHQMKTQMAEDSGIFLMHIFGYEWEHKKEILKSMISNNLSCCKYRIYARETYIKEISYNEAYEFLNTNHRQGGCSNRIRLGLLTKESNELVSLMTFGSTRPGMGRQEDDTESTYELIRFCSKLNTSVVGGASKLFKHFVENYSPTKIISFSDRAHTKGTLYEKLGFVEVSRQTPSYCWVKPYGEVYRSRVSCQKHNLVKSFEDVTEETISNKSEREIMIEHGYLQVFDSGVIRWEWTSEGKEE